MDKLKAVFFGTPEFSVPCLDILYKSEFVEVIHVVTMPDRPAGRGKKLQSPPVAVFAKDNNLPLTQTANINEENELLNTLKEADFFLVIAFAQFLSSKVLNIPKIACFNIHTSLLPKYRGAAPIQYALLNGDKTTGVSIQKMVKKMDAGDIVFSKEIEIDENETSNTLFKKLEQEAAISLDEFLHQIKNNTFECAPQSEQNVSFAPTIKKSDGFIDFKNESAINIKNKFRAYYPWPGIYFYLNNLRIKVHGISISQQELKAGEIDLSMGNLIIGTKDGAVHLKEVQLDGKKTCSDIDLLRGLKNKYDHFEVTNG